MSNTNDAGGSKDIPDNFPAEDLVLKSAMQFFGDELLSYLKITAEPVRQSAKRNLSIWKRSSYMKTLTSLSLTRAGFIWSLRATVSRRRICAASAVMKQSPRISVTSISRLT